jgi:uncharacterized protein YqhQ
MLVDSDDDDKHKNTIDATRLNYKFYSGFTFVYYVYVICIIIYVLIDTNWSLRNQLLSRNQRP